MPDRAAHIEQNTIYPIPAAERHGRAEDLFTVWFGSNIMILTIVTGALATVRFQLSLAPDGARARRCGHFLGRGDRAGESAVLRVGAAQGPGR